MTDEAEKSNELSEEQDNDAEKLAARMVLFAAMEDIPKELALLLEVEASNYGYVSYDLVWAANELNGEAPMKKNILMALHEARKKASHILQRVNDIESIYVGYLQHLNQKNNGGDK